MVDELKNKLKHLFGSNQKLKSDLAKVSQEMYRRNVELAETNKTLSLLQTIDTLVLGSNDSLPSLCQNIAKAIESTTDYAYVGVSTRPSRNDNNLVLYGRSIQGETGQNSLDISHYPTIKIEDEWFKG